MKEISAALVKAQKAFGPALKSSTNPHFKSRYADLAACVEAVIDGLNNNGIFLMQSSHLSDDGVIVETIFIHESGEQMSAGKLHVPASKHDAQGYGSALTYARRYALMAACGIAPEDDDGNASKRPEPRVEHKPPVKHVEEKPPAESQGKPGNWRLTIKTTPEATIKDYSDIVTDATKILLEQAQSMANVMDIFSVNKNIFDNIKKQDAETYDKLVSMFKERKLVYSKVKEQPDE